MDMMNQFLKPIKDYEVEPGLIKSDKAIMPEMVVIDNYAKEHYEQTGTPLEIKICVTGPVECYIKEHNFTVYKDIALNYSKSINAFLKNSIINTKYMKTPLISIDEPSFGYVDLFNVDNNDLIEIYDKSISEVNTTNQIHLHSLNRADIALQSKNIDVLTCEYAADRTNKIPRKDLEQHDKFIRVGISRTNVNRIMSDALDSGLISTEDIKTVESSLKLVDSKERIEKRLLEALELYGDRLKYVGPDCGFSGWSLPTAAYELLRRTSEVVQEVKSSKS
jgi:5-methyltetrahydropteroyltriglutamate--homocysteine methyltransferase